jgi:hypothetical protein
MAKRLDRVVFAVLGAGGGLAATAAGGPCSGSCSTCLQCFAAGGVGAILVIAARLRGGVRVAGRRAGGGCNCNESLLPEKAGLRTSRGLCRRGSGAQ